MEEHTSGYCIEHDKEHNQMAQIKTLRKIAERMGWSPSTVLRRHKLDDFPLYLDWTKRGLIWVTSDELILKWEERKVQMCQGARLRPPRRRRHKPDYKPYNWRLRDGNRTDSGTVGPQFRGENEQTVREEAQLGPTPAQRELDVIAPETPAVVTKEPRAGFPPTPPPHPALSRPLDCTCGKATRCQAHD